MAQLKQREQIYPFSAFFVLFRPSRDWMLSIHIGEGKSFNLSLPSRMLISSRNTLTDTPRNNVLPVIWASLSPVKLTQKINHHNVIHYFYKSFLKLCCAVENIIIV